MLCKVSSKNQITIPKELLKHFQNSEYFDARLEGDKIVLEPMIVRPLESKKLEEIRNKIGSLGITEQDIPQLVAESRHEYHS